MRPERTTPGNIPGSIDRRDGITALASLKHYLAGTALDEMDAALLHRLRELGDASEGELAASLSLARSTASRHAMRLSDLGLVSERILPSDMRATHLGVSDGGKSVLFEISKAIGSDCLAAAVDAVGFLQGSAKTLRAENGTALSASAYAALYLLSFGAMSPGELSQTLGQRQPSTSMMLKRLKEQGYVAAGADPADARRLIVSLTPAGETLVSNA